MKLKRKRMLIIAVVVVCLATFGVLFSVHKAYAGRGNYYERGEDGRIYYHGEGNDPTVQMIITPMPGEEGLLLEETEDVR